MAHNYLRCTHKEKMRNKKYIRCLRDGSIRKAYKCTNCPFRKLPLWKRILNKIKEI